MKGRAGGLRVPCQSREAANAVGSRGDHSQGMLQVGKDL